MLGDEPGTLAPVLDPAALRPAPAEVCVPDPDVLDNARQRLASHYATSGGRYSRQLLTVPADDIRAVGAVISAVRSGAERPADALDVGAGLAVLSHLRHCLDELETDLLDGAQQVGLSWDVIAAILGIPVIQAQSRHRSLRARLDAQ
jgi:hypothetical protein